MNSFGFKEEEFDEIKEVLKRHSLVDKVVLFGSRAKNTFKPMSDVDLVVYGDKLNYKEIAAIESSFEDSNLPFLFDIVNFSSISSPELYEHIEQYGKIIYLKGWMDTTLGDIINIIGGGTPKTSINDYWDGEIPWLSVVDFNDDKRWVSEAEKSITKLGLKKSSTKLLAIGDIIISARGTVGAMAQLKKEMAFNQSCYGIKEKENISDKNFLFYLLKYSLKKINRNTYGAVFDTITKKTFDIINVNLPPLSEQKSIAAILTAFDDKIENLQAQNKTLEETAQTIFKEWFGKYQIGDELPEGWRVGTIGEVTKSVGGTTPSTKNSDFWDGDIHWTSPKDLSNSKEVFLLKTEKKITDKGLKKISSGLLPKRTLLLSSRAPVGYLSLTNIELAINQGYIALLPNQYLSNNYMYLWLSLNLKIVENAANGSTFLEISKSSFRNIDCLIPEINILQGFDDIIYPTFEKILSNLSQIQTLTQTRDTLLPKLMSGELRVSDC